MSTVIADTLVKNLSEGAVAFKYRKTDGSVREANGTIKTDMIPEGKRGATAPTTDGPTVSYFDLDAKDWRSFRKDSVVA